MLVIISDLHFEEESSRNIPGGGTYAPIYIRRNIPPAAFRKIFTQLHEQAKRDKAQRIDLVLAGDIFDLNRTALWFRNNPSDARPYTSNQEIQPGSPEEGKVLEILAAIDHPDQSVHTILQSIRDLAAKGTYTNVEFRQQSFSRAYKDEAGRAWEADIPVQTHYIPGNHDRLANATPAIRQKVRQLLGVVGSGEPFPVTLNFPAEKVFIRHGHEYDHYNFAADLRKTPLIPRQLPQEHYDNPPFGDFVTVDIVSRISEVFRAHYGDEAILADSLLRQLYERALEFDDLRPLRAILNYLLHIPQDEQLTGHSYDPAALWRERVRPVIKRLRDDLYAQNRQYSWLQKLVCGRGLDPVIVLVRLALWLPIWNFIPYWLVQWLSSRGIKSYKQEASKAVFASREQTIRSGEHVFLVAGHTHRPAVELIGRSAAGEQYYVDTGTWRHRIPTSPDLKTFGRIKTLTYAVVYGPNEDLGEMATGQKLVSFDHWSGFSHRWEQP